MLSTTQKVGRNGSSLYLLLAAVLAGCSTTESVPPGGTATPREEIYVLRSVTEKFNPGTEWCASSRTGFAPFPTDADRVFSFWAVQTQSKDGRVSNTKLNRAAEGRACFGPTPDRSVVNFYAEGSFGGTPIAGAGECRVLAVDSPEKGLVVLNCLLKLRGLPAPYVGGVLISNTIASRAPLGGETDPPGYTQSSIATIRLWKSQ